MITEELTTTVVIGLKHLPSVRRTISLPALELEDEEEVEELFEDVEAAVETETLADKLVEVLTWVPNPTEVETCEPVEVLSEVCVPTPDDTDVWTP